MLVLVQWAQQTDEEILGMSFSITIILSVLHRVLSPIHIMRMPMLFGHTMIVMSPTSLVIHIQFQKCKVESKCQASGMNTSHYHE